MTLPLGSSRKRDNRRRVVCKWSKKRGRSLAEENGVSGHRLVPTFVRSVDREYQSVFSLVWPGRIKSRLGTWLVILGALWYTLSTLITWFLIVSFFLGISLDWSKRGKNLRRKLPLSRVHWTSLRMCSIIRSSFRPKYTPPYYPEVELTWVPFFPETPRICRERSMSVMVDRTGLRDTRIKKGSRKFSYQPRVPVKREEST